MPEHQVTAQGLEKEHTEFSIRSRLHAQTLTIFKSPDQLYKGLSLVHQENRNSRQLLAKHGGELHRQKTTKYMQSPDFVLSKATCKHFLPWASVFSSIKEQNHQPGKWFCKSNLLPVCVTPILNCQFRNWYKISLSWNPHYTVWDLFKL